MRKYVQLSETETSSNQLYICGCKRQTMIYRMSFSLFIEITLKFLVNTTLFTNYPQHNSKMRNYENCFNCYPTYLFHTSHFLGTFLKYSSGSWERECNFS
jgi:hypothetical protein